METNENPDLGGPGSQEVRDNVEVTSPAKGLSPDHAKYLAAQAVKPEVAEALGVVSIVRQTDAESLGDDFWAANYNRVPYLAFPWRSPTGRVEWQLRPDEPGVDDAGRSKKYIYRSKKRGYQPVLWEVRKVDSPTHVLIVEGTKQCLAAAGYAPDGVAVYGIGGCRQWTSEGLPIPDLAIGEDQHVVILLDADAATNPEVYDAGVKLGGAFMDEGARKVSYAQITGAGEKDGLDDVLGQRAEDKRASFLARIIERAADKPASTRPRARSKKKEPSPPPIAADGRKTVVVNQDRKIVKDELTAAMVGMFSGTELFNYGQVISRYADGWMSPLDRGAFNDVSSEAALMVSDDGDGGYAPGWADPNVMTAVLSRASHFAPLDRISRAPFVRADGSVCVVSGYDEGSRTMVALDESLEGFTIPDEPSPEEIEAARSLLADEMLGGFPFVTTADRANALALMITPAIRGMVPTVPLAVIDGVRKGVGKGKVASCLALIHTGLDAELGGYSDSDEEMRKSITSTLREGRDLVFMDEAHKLEGGSLARMLTAATWKDRILGVSKNETLPNKSTWISMGNKVELVGDIDRRVYRIAIGLAPGHLRPEDRPASDFSHPDLENWVREHRRELLSAVLILVRAWFVAGQPCERERTFQSFTDWERVVGGVLEVAGVKDFLGNRKEWRAESDYEQQTWDAHFYWLLKVFPDGETFTCREVTERARFDKTFSGPPNLSDPAKDGFTEGLGYAYRSHRASETLKVVLTKMGKAHNSVNAYAVLPESSYFKTSLGGDGGDGGDGYPYVQAGNGEHRQEGALHRTRKNGAVRSAPIAPIAPERSPRRPESSDLPCSDCNARPGEPCPGVPADPTGELDGLCDARADLLVDARNAWSGWTPGDEPDDLLIFN